MLDTQEESDGQKYTNEQKIVSAVWVHERHFNDQTWKDITENFKARFNMPAPSKLTFMSWENKLFTQGNVLDTERSGRPTARLMHVPYVKSSLEENPHLSLRERARILGIPRTTLLTILQDDLHMTFEVNSDTMNPNKRHAAKNNGIWKKMKIETETDSTGSSFNML